WIAISLPVLIYLPCKSVPRVPLDMFANGREKRMPCSRRRADDRLQDRRYLLVIQAASLENKRRQQRGRRPGGQLLGLGRRRRRDRFAQPRRRRVGIEGLVHLLLEVE